MGLYLVRFSRLLCFLKLFIVGVVVIFFFGWDLLGEIMGDRFGFFFYRGLVGVEGRGEVLGL